METTEGNVMTHDTKPTPEIRAQRRVQERSGLLWHLATFIIINGFLWAVDAMQGGIDWAYWVTLSWGIGLLFHIAAYMIDVAGSSRRYQRYLDEERQSDAA